MSKNIKIVLDVDINTFLDNHFPTAERIAELRKKVEAIRAEMEENLKVIEYCEKLNNRKTLMSN